MKMPVFALVAASLLIPAAGLSQSQGGKSDGKRQDTDFPPETRGECQRAAQRANSDARKNNETIRYECVEENGQFFVRPTAE